MRTLILCLFALPSFGQHLADSLQGTYTCYRVEGEVNTYHFNSSTLLDLLGAFGTSPSMFDLNDDGQVNSSDILAAVGGYAAPPPTIPDFTLFSIFDNFGEGNTWLWYLGDDPSVSFGWLHRTPFDEAEDANYIGFNIKTFTFDQVGVDGITYFYFVRE